MTPRRRKIMYLFVESCTTTVHAVHDSRRGLLATYLCKHCKGWVLDHENGKCLFDVTHYERGPEESFHRFVDAHEHREFDLPKILLVDAETCDLLMDMYDDPDAANSLAPRRN